MLTNPRGELAGKLAAYRKQDPRFDAVCTAVEKDFNAATHLTAHNWEHAYRDTCNAIVIGEAEGADMRIVLSATVMHDIGFLWGATGKTHGEVGAQKLGEFLDRHGLAFTPEEQEHIAACIRTHKGSMHGHVPETLEAQVVADADLLEKFGAFGVYQYIRTYGEFNYPLEKILGRKEEAHTLTLSTKTGQEIADRGRALVSEFFTKLDTAQDVYRSTQES